MDDFGGGDAWINKPILFQSQGQWMNFGDWDGDGEWKREKREESVGETVMMMGIVTKEGGG
jgi:hypothetical protein